MYACLVVVQTNKIEVKIKLEDEQENAIEYNVHHM
jgi:hypothetical protein